jgi:hypothetical protein
MPAFDMVVVGCGGGPDETNLSAYVLVPFGTPLAQLLQLSLQTVRFALGRWYYCLGGWYVSVPYVDRSEI